MRKSWALAVVGLLALGVLIWFAGPLVGGSGQAPLGSPQTRLLVVAVLALQYLGQKLWQTRRARQNNERLVSALAPAPESGLPAEAVQLRERFSNALGELRRVRFGAREGRPSWKFARSYLYQIPWYMIIGAPGAGKTTALMNSGLSFPLASKLGRGSVRGIGGTRNCDWWFTDRAVLIDTAGRYTTHETDRVADRQAWGVFLELLRQTRPQRPLNGVLVAVSVSDLLELSVDGIVEHGRVLRARLDELQLAFRVRLPVYFLLTKCDLLPGFVDWFGTLDRRDREQPWGITFDVRASDSGQASAQFAGEFERLVNRLADGLTGRMQAERDMQRRARIFSLPRQLRAMGGPLDSLVRRTFGPSAASAGAAASPYLRGVYLTSGTQQGTPIDRMLSAFGRELGLERQILPPNQGSGKSFFLTRLLTDVVFAEARLSGRKALRRRTGRRLQLAVIVALQLCALALAIWWTRGYFRTVDDLARFDGEVTRIRGIVDAMPTRASPDPRALLPVLNAMGALARPVPGSDSSDLVDLGSRSRRKLVAAARAAYDQMLLGPFQRRISKAIDASLRAGADANLQYEALKAYAMLRDPGHFDAGGFKVFVMSYLDSALSPPLSPSERTELGAHLDALIKAGAVQSGTTIEPALIESVKRRLSAQSPAQRIALRLSAVLDDHPYSDFTVASLGPDPAALFVGSDGRSPPHPVPGRYTIEAYRGAVAKEVPTLAAQLTSEADWVLGAPQAADGAAIAEFKAAYGRAFARAWADLIDDLHLKSAASDGEAIQQARMLGAANGPLAQLLVAIVRETSPGLLTGEDGPIAPSDPLATRLIALHSLVTPDAGGELPLDGALQLFREIAIARAAAAASAPPNERLARVIADAAREPEPIHSMLLSLAAPSASTPMQLAASAPMAPASPAALARQIAARLGVDCLRLVAGHFPFDRGAGHDASLEDFSRMFAPKGAFDRVFTQLLASHVDTSSDAWQPRGPGVAPDAEELERFRSAARIREAFFSGGGAEPAIQLTFRPLDMDPDIDRFLLEIDGQFVRYAHGPATATVITWPGPQGSARVEVTPAAEGEPLEYSGRWALFRLLDHAAIQEAGSPGRFHVVFDVGGHHASFEVQSGAGADPFRLRELEHFSCPMAGLGDAYLSPRSR
jgi:type VI secretion system protein ImpL